MEREGEASGCMYRTEANESRGKQRRWRQMMRMEADPRLTYRSPSHPATTEPAIRMAASIAHPYPAILAYEGGESVARQLKWSSAITGIGRESEASGHRGRQ